jgi:hypothetical protein
MSTEVLALAALVGCGGATLPDSGDGSACQASDPQGPGGREHRPGEACASVCHAPANSGGLRDFAISGTVFSSLHTPDDCVGDDASAPFTELVIQDRTNAVMSFVLSGTGNFSYQGSYVSPPFSVSVWVGGKENAAVTPHANGDCNSCHTEQGANGAPGRIVAP